MQQGFSQSQSLKQEQLLSSGQIQSLEILQLPQIMLEQRIREEIEVNPTLEIIEKSSEDLSGDLMSDGFEQSAQSENDAAQLISQDESMLTMIQMDDTWRDRVGSAGNYNPDQDDARQFHLDSYCRSKTLEDHLLEQLNDSRIDEELRRLGEQVVSSIDDRGYLNIAEEDLAMVADCSKSEIKEAIELVQNFDPPGIAARDLQECLLLQLEHIGEERSMAAKIIKKHLDEISKNQIPQVAKKLKITPSKLYAELEVIQKLNPYPGSLYASKDSDFIAPDIFIEEDDFGDFKVRSNRAYNPRIRISKQYLQMLEDPNSSKEVKDYVRERIGSSKQLMNALKNRESTLMRISRQILMRQEDFFRDGVEKMIPMTMQKIADALELHETTISRAMSNKYMQCPQGLLPFKYFFNSGYISAYGDMVTSLSIKQEIKDMVILEERQSPLSDGDLEEHFVAKGFKITRRTIAKYRESIGIAPANLRKTF